MSEKYAIGVDIGGQSTKIGVVKENGDIIARDAFKYAKGMKYEELLEQLNSSVNTLIAGKIDKSEILGIGVGAPNGNYLKGTIEFAPNLEWAKDENGVSRCLNFADDLGALSNLKVALTNDANAAAMGEMIYGGAKGMKDFIMITLGTGVGSGIVIDGKVVYGSDGFAGELGHVNAVRGGRLCGCGLKGCLEAYCSAVGVARTTGEFLEKYPDKKTLLRGTPINKETSIKVCEAARAGDELALEIFNYTGTLLGEAFANFIAFSAPQAIFLFGGLTKASEFIMDPIIKAMNENVVPIWRNKVAVLLSELDDADAAILGASALVY